MVEKDSKIYVLKAPGEHTGNRYLKAEIKALKNGSGITGIPRLISVYYECENEPKAILREYIEGETLCNLPSNSHLERKLRETVLELHNIGIVIVDIKDRNIIISPDRLKVKIIDLDFAEFDNGSKSYFEKMKRKDIEDLNSIFSIFKQKARK